MAVIRYPDGAILCVADVHLEAEAPERLEVFRRFLLDVVAVKASALYILGDLFTAWPGDEVGEATVFEPLLGAFRAIHELGITVYVLHGNHDFLMGDVWCKKAHMIRIQDGYILNWVGQHWYLLHGDTLCTEDIHYQAFRYMVRNPDWQKTFLALPLEARLKEIEHVRGRSEQEKALKPEGIMDVSLDAVMHLWEKHPEVTGIIHGHTHRPARHAYRVKDRVYTRWVLPDWIRSPGYGVLSGDGRNFTLSV